MRSLTVVTYESFLEVPRPRAFNRAARPGESFRVWWLETRSGEAMSGSVFGGDCNVFLLAILLLLLESGLFSVRLGEEEVVEEVVLFWLVSGAAAQLGV